MTKRKGLLDIDVDVKELLAGLSNNCSNAPKQETLRNKRLSHLSE
ncbi:hypothetical protein [Bacillus cereus]|nr:hypothetical protein [Bacillus cereus]